MPRYRVSLGTVGARDWGDRPVAIVGGGPSLSGFKFERLKGRFTVLALNASIFDLPWADCGFTIDRRAARNWWPRLVSETTMPLVFAIPDQHLTNFSASPTPRMSFVRRVQRSTLSTSPYDIAAGGTSGFGALNLAFLRGARRIVLLGFDYQPSPLGAWHHNEQHYFPHIQRAADWQQWAQNFETAAPMLRAAGVKVLNASERSAITAFPRVSIDEALA
jgi:hypothetical protein